MISSSSPLNCLKIKDQRSSTGDEVKWGKQEEANREVKIGLRYFSCKQLRKTATLIFSPTPHLLRSSHINNVARSTAGVRREGRPRLILGRGSKEGSWARGLEGQGWMTGLGIQWSSEASFGIAIARESCCCEGRRIPRSSDRAPPWRIAVLALSRFSCNVHRQSLSTALHRDHRLSEH